MQKIKTVSQIAFLLIFTSFSLACQTGSSSSSLDFAQQAYVKALNPDAADLFGYSVAVSGDTLVVGSLVESSSATGVDGDATDNGADSSGAVSVYTRDADGVWTQQAYLKASNAEAEDEFGYSVAIDGDTLVVTAPCEASQASGVGGDESDNSAPFAGAAYVFVRDANGVWSQEAYLKASNTETEEFFGSAAAISGDTIVVGAHYEKSGATGVNGNESDNSASGAGAAYVFVRDSSDTWSQQAYLKASNTEASDAFGYTVGIDGDTLVVGSLGDASNATGVNGDETDNSAPGSGAAYVFFRDSDDAWSQQAYLKASNPESMDVFGGTVAVSGDTVVVGAIGEDSGATGIDGDETDNSASISGAAYVFTRDADDVWSQEAYLKASNSGASDSFGFSVAIDDDVIVVGATGESSDATGVNGDESDDSADDSGAAYVFTRNSSGTWSQHDYLKASNTAAGDGFGFCVAVEGETIGVGAPEQDSSATGIDGEDADTSLADSGAAYIF